MPERHLCMRQNHNVGVTFHENESSLRCINTLNRKFQRVLDKACITWTIVKHFCVKRPHTRAPSSHISHPQSTPPYSDPTTTAVILSKSCSSLCFNLVVWKQSGQVEVNPVGLFGTLATWQLVWLVCGHCIFPPLQLQSQTMFSTLNTATRLFLVHFRREVVTMLHFTEKHLANACWRAADTGSRLFFKASLKLWPVIS